MPRNLWVQPTPFGVNSQHAQWPPNSPTEACGVRSGCNSFILHLLYVGHWVASLASGPLSRRGRGDATPPSKWDGVPETEWALCKLQQQHFPSLALCRSNSTHSICLLFRLYSPSPSKILLKFHFLKKPSLSPEHSRENMDKAASTAGTGHSQ